MKRCVFGALVVLLLAAAAFADITITATGSGKGLGMGANMQTTTYIKGKSPTVTAVTVGALSDDLFVVPADFKSKNK
jgi:hypothetical protein